MTSKIPFKVNIGSGLSGAEGWYNIDNSPTVLLSRLCGFMSSRIPDITLVELEERKHATVHVEAEK